jgi:hypothetical protein
MSVLYTRAPRLFADLAIPDGDVCCVRYAVGNDCYLREGDGWSRRFADIAIVMARRPYRRGYDSMIATI